jgi:hypothetical protein
VAAAQGLVSSLNALVGELLGTLASMMNSPGVVFNSVLKFSSFVILKAPLNFIGRLNVVS